MNYRTLGKTGFKISEISLGTWQVGGKWGEKFDQLMKEGKILKLGVSVEKVEEALKAIEYPHVDTVQIIFNVFRQRPRELFFQQAKKKNIGVIVRVPLASGLLSGKFDQNTTFSEGDHRNYNKMGSTI